MRLLNNDDVRTLLDMPSTIAALRTGYDDLASDGAAYIPRIDLYAPTDRHDDGYYRWGSMAGASRSFDVVATRMKSDVVTWPGGRTEEKYCVEPGTFCGLVLVFRITDGAPLAIIQDGYLQHMRVGASAGIGVDVLARKGPLRLGLLGSGGMAETFIDAIAEVRELVGVRVFSPTAAHRDRFAAAAAERLGVPVEPVASAQLAVEGADVVARATDSLEPTFEAVWLEPGATVVCVSRRELSAGILERADRHFQLGHSTIRPGVDVPGMEWSLQGKAAYVVGTAEERRRLPSRRGAERVVLPLLTDVMAGDVPGRTSDDEVILYMNGGTQGLQFAAVAGQVVRTAVERGVGRALPLEWFLEDIRD